MRTNLLRASWTSGPDDGQGGPVLVSVTDFRLDRLLDLPGVHRAARRLAAGWPELEGAHGMWLWARPAARRCGAVAVWRDEAALRGFVAWPPHVEIMRAYRGRGSLTSTTWTSPGFDPRETWARARAGLLTD
ncbi:hypothetical protein DSC45_02210 [Streptomyces sp. YIM 130001]|uniref:hypothetical protein n=1 Tax=Streptomyces sp. YIM 130001 TaxID=2259644 RepID=UPI000E64E48A|nr:hypothetical protein [Streptomyces sp. YIM 130001]RII20917.1 hypothetical protein DSC45_02210 [Streptomyces sp. YIM 130001]